MQLVENHRLQYGEPVAHRRPERDLGCLIEIARLDRNLPNLQTLRHSLRDDVRIEDESVGVGREIHRLEITSTVGSEPAVVLRQVDQERRVFDCRQEDVAEVLPFRHPSLKRLSSQHPAPEDGVALSAKEWIDQVRNHGRVVLVIRVNHHDNLGASLESRAIAGLLVRPVAEVGRVHDDVKPEAVRLLDRPIARGVIDENDVVDAPLRDIRVRPLERLFRVVGRHDDGHLRSHCLGRET